MTVKDYLLSYFPDEWPPEDYRLDALLRHADALICAFLHRDTVPDGLDAVRASLGFALYVSFVASDLFDFSHIPPSFSFPAHILTWLRPYCSFPAPAVPAVPLPF